MRTIINVVLFICVIIVGYSAVNSIVSEQKGEETFLARSKKIQGRLRQIAVLEDEYKKLNPDGRYCDNMAELIRFCKEDSLKYVIEEGTLTADQMDGKVGGLELTDSIAAAIVARGNATEIAKYGLEGYRRDTMKIALMDSIINVEGFDASFNPEDLRYIPFSKNVEFELEVFDDVTRSGAALCTMQCGAPYAAFIDRDSYGTRKLNLLKATAEARGTYAGWKIGGIGSDQWNNNAGNWE